MGLPWRLRWGFPGDSDGQESACNAGDLGSIPGLGRPPWRRNWLPTSAFCQANPMDRGTWWAGSDTTEWLTYVSATNICLRERKKKNNEFILHMSILRALPSSCGPQLLCLFPYLTLEGPCWWQKGTEPPMMTGGHFQVRFWASNWNWTLIRKPVIF